MHESLFGGFNDYYSSSNLQKPPELDAPLLETTDAEKEVKSVDPELLDLQTNVF